MQPLAVPSLPSAVTAAAGEQSTNLRVGRVVGINSAELTVNVGGTNITAVTYLASYTPILGDYVQIAWQGTSLLVLGSVTGNPADNAVANHSFEADPPLSSAITSWTKYVGSGTATVRVSTADEWTRIDGAQMAEIYQTTAATSETSLISAPIPVANGERWTAAVWWLAYADGVSTPMVAPTVSLSLTWYANAAGAYPATAAADTLIMQAAGPFGAMPDWSLLRAQSGAGTLVPGGVTAMRVKLTATHDTTGGAWFDKVIARKVS